MLFYAIQIIASLLACYYYREKQIRCFSILTITYFISYYMSGSYDVSLSLYCVFIVLSSGKPSKMNLSEIILFAWILLYTIIGIVLQNFRETMMTLVTRYGFIILYIYISISDKNKKCWKISASDSRFIVWCGILTECLIVLLVWSKSGIGARVVTNNQPIGGGFVTSLLTVVGWCYLQKWFSALETMMYCIFFLIIIVLSGTRGYMLIGIFIFAVIFLSYILDIPNKGKAMQLRISTCFLISSILIPILLIINQWFPLSNILRLNEGLGYRENENYFVIEIMKNAPFFNVLFGFGIGGLANHIDGFYQIVQMASWNRRFMFKRLLTKTLFHNYWYTILFKQGIVGLFITICYFAGMLHKVLKLDANTWFKGILSAMIIGCVVSQTYRITATCLIFETIIISIFIKTLTNCERDE